MTFLSLLSGPAVLSFLQYKNKDLTFLQRLCNFSLCFLMAYGLSNVLFAKGLLEPWGFWIYCALCSIATALVLKRSFEKKWNMDHWMVLFLGLMILIYIGLYFYEPLLGQELMAVEIAKKPIADLVQSSWVIAANPPLYFILLKVWISVFGTGSAVLRLFGYIPMAILAISSFFWMKKNRPESLFLWMALILLMPISLRNNTFVWGYLASVLCAVWATFLLFECFDDLSISKVLFSAVLFVLAGWFHFAGWFAAIVGMISWIYVSIRYKKGFSWILLSAIILVSIVVQLLLIRSSLVIDNAPKLLEDYSVWSFFVSVFSAWEGNEWFDILLLFNFLSLFYILVYPPKGQRGKMAWIALVTLLFPVVFFGVGYGYERFIAYWREIEITNRSFVPVDFIVWLSFSMICWMAFKKKQMMNLVLGFYLVVASYGAGGWLSSEAVMLRDLHYAQNIFNRYSDYGYTFVPVNYRGIIGYDSYEQELVFERYVPSLLEIPNSANTLKELPYNGEKYFVFSEEKLTKGLKEVLGDMGHEWDPLGTIYLPGYHLYIYCFE